MKQKLVPGQKIICLNHQASFNYFFRVIGSWNIFKGSSKIAKMEKEV